jgi:predicted small secreted protein
LFFKGKVKMKKIASILFLTVVLLASLFAIAGCNTVEGVGKDIERGGEAIQDVAD